MAATDAYRAESDTFALWFDERCTNNPKAEWKASLAFASYRNWCEEANERAVGQRKFGERVLQEGFERLPRRRDGFYYLGFELLSHVGEPCE